MPIRNAAKDLILNFFGDKANEEMAAAQSEQDDFIDDLDDSELLGCPDPSSLNTNVEQTPFPYRYNYDQSMAKVHNPKSFIGHVPFTLTPMVPPQQPGHRSTLSIIPDSFSVQHGQHYSHTQQMLSNSGFRPVVQHESQDSYMSLGIISSQGMMDEDNRETMLEDSQSPGGQRLVTAMMVDSPAQPTSQAVGYK